MEYEKEIKKAKIVLLEQLPFYSDLLLKTKIREAKEIQTASMSIKGDMKYNPKFFEDLKQEQITFTFLHEIIHKAFLHPFRRGKRQPKLWNIAVDIKTNNKIHNLRLDITKEIENTINSENQAEFKDVVIEDINNKTCEEIYKELKQEINEDDIEKLEDNPNRFDRHGDPEKGHKKETWSASKKEKEKAKKKIRDEINSAKTQAEQRGDIPQDIKKQIEHILKPQVNWAKILKRFVTNRLPKDYTIRKPNRRYIGQDVYLPGEKTEGLDLICVVDLSGSMGVKQRKEVFGEVIDITKTFENIKLTVVSHDSSVNTVKEFDNPSVKEIMKTEFKGGGGTDHKPVFEWLEENDLNNEVVVCFTDGYSRFPAEPRKNVIWVLTENGCDPEYIPFGKVVKISQ